MAESLLDDVASFMREPGNRNIRVDVEERMSTELVRQVREGTSAIGVCWDNVDLGGLQAQPYRQDRLAIATHRDHPLAGKKSIDFEQTLAYDHVGLPPNSSVHTMLRRAAANAGKTIAYRAVVSNLDASFRVVAAGLGISVVPVEVARTYRRTLGLRVIPLSDAWAYRRFVVCFKDFDALQPPAQRLVKYLKARAEDARSRT
jgi:DNA-binding transcriptional LysR family regulator